MVAGGQQFAIVTVQGVGFTTIVSKNLGTSYRLSKNEKHDIFLLNTNLKVFTMGLEDARQKNSVDYNLTNLQPAPTLCT